MKRLIYLSSACTLMSQDALDAVLSDSRAWNGDHGVTGLLLYCEGSFLQCLEGEAADVDVTFAKIERARQHRGILRVHEDADAAGRLFGEWAMGFKAATADGIRQGFMDLRDLGRSLGEEALGDPELGTMIKTFFATVRDPALTLPGSAAPAPRPGAQPVR